MRAKLRIIIETNKNLLENWVNFYVIAKVKMSVAFQFQLFQFQLEKTSIQMLFIYYITN